MPELFLDDLTHRASLIASILYFMSQTLNQRISKKRISNYVTCMETNVTYLNSYTRLFSCSILIFAVIKLYMYHTKLRTLTQPSSYNEFQRRKWIYLSYPLHLWKITCKSTVILWPSSKDQDHSQIRPF